MILERSEKTVFYASVERSIFKNNRLDGLRILSNVKNERKGRFLSFL
jgi:hypothetical protein